MGTTNFDAVEADTFTGDLTGDVTAATVTATTSLTVSGATVIMSALPTSDPAVAGQLWSNSGVLTVSAG